MDSGEARTQATPVTIVLRWRLQIVHTIKMDKKNLFLGLALLGAAFFLFSWQARQAMEYEETRQSEEPEKRAVEGVEQDPSRGDALAGDGVDSRGETPSAESGVDGDLTGLGLDTGSVEAASEEKVILENEHLRVTLSNLGGTIEKVEFFETYPEGEVDPFVFNDGDVLPSHLIEFPDPNGRLVPFSPAFEISEYTASKDRVTFTHRDGNGLIFERTYRLARQNEGQDPYIIEHHLMVTNESDSTRVLPTTYLRLGATRSLAYDRMNVGEFLNVSYYNGNKIGYVKGRKFIGSRGFFGIGRREPIPNFREEVSLDNLRWASIKNQFFVGILKEIPSESSISRARRLIVEASQNGNPEAEYWKGLGITGTVGYELGMIPPGETLQFGTEFFIGPKEFLRLQALGGNKERLMQYWGPDIISQGMTLLMHGIHKLVPNWGLAIIFLTLSIKLFFWPFTSRGMRAQKLNAVKMTPLQGEMKKLNEKYKDNPQAKQKAMMQLYKKHDVNPAAMMGGCLPMLIQIPVFIGLYGMLRVAPEFRFASLLWIEQLAYPDTIATIRGFPINLLPLVYGVVMYFQMRMTPVPETADETQKMTFKMMRFMPLLLVVWLYNFAAALFVYFTTNAILTMLQQFLINKKLEPEIKALKAEIEKKHPKEGETAVGPAPWEKKDKPKDKEKKGLAAKQMVDGLGATRRLKGGGGAPSRRGGKRKKKK